MRRAAARQRCSHLHTYSRNEGVFAGVSLEGSGVGVDEGSTEEVYGEEVTATVILIKRSVSINDVVRPFVDTLNRHTPVRATE
ncbi:MAG: YSC84-related protein [Vicinamibacteria bacterium]